MSLRDSSPLASRAAFPTTGSRQHPHHLHLGRESIKEVSCCRDIEENAQLRRTPDVEGNNKFTFMGRAKEVAIRLLLAKVLAWQTYGDKADALLPGCAL